MKKKALIFLLLLFCTSMFANAEHWVDTGNKTQSKIYIDTDSIYKYSEGSVVYAIKYLNSENNEIVATIFANIKHKIIGVIAAEPYKPQMKYNYNINDNINMKLIKTKSPIYPSYLIAQGIYNTKDLKSIDTDEQNSGETLNIGPLLEVGVMSLLNILLH